MVLCWLHMVEVSYTFPVLQVILLADILPTFIIKLVAPYFMNFIPYWWAAIPL